MITFDIIKKNINEYNLFWTNVSDHAYRLLITGGSGSGKTNSLFNLISHQLNIDRIYLYVKDSYEAKYKLLFKKRESTGLKHLNESKAFIEHSNDMDDIHKNIEEYNPNKERKILIVLMIWLLISLVKNTLIQ